MRRLARKGSMMMMISVYCFLADVICINYRCSVHFYYFNVHDIRSHIIIESVADMSEEVFHQQGLRLSILGLKRYHVHEWSYRHQVNVPNMARVMASSSFHAPHVVIQYRLGIEQQPNSEIWSWDMIPTATGFSVVSITKYCN